MLDPGVEEDSLTLGVDTAPRHAQVVDKTSGQTVILEWESVILHGSGAQLQQGGRLERHLPDEPDHQGVVPQRQLGQAAQEDQSVWQSRQLILKMATILE